MTEQTPNPFDALGGGGFDMNALLQQAQQMQERLEDAQAQLADTTVEGSVGGGVVTVTVNGIGELVDEVLDDAFVHGGCQPPRPGMPPASGPRALLASASARPLASR